MARGVFPRIDETGRPQGATAPRAAGDDVTRFVVFSLIAGLATVFAVVWRSLV
jgi:hypothetical protein